MLFKSPLVLLFIEIFLPVNGLNILGLFPHPGKSHVDVFLPLMKALAEKGHDVTVLSNFPLKNPPKRYRDLNLENVIPPLVNVFDLDVKKASGAIEKMSQVLLLKYFSEMTYEEVLKSKAAQTLIHSEEKFDVIIAELFNSDSFMAFAHKFDAPVIGLSSCAIMPWTSDRFGNPTNPGYVPNILMHFSDRMTFFERVQNLIAQAGTNLFFHEVMLKHDDLIARRYFGQDLPPLNEIVFNYTSLLLVNTHHSLNLPRPLVPAVVEIGGIHVGKPQKLPDNIEKWINESEHGVIYFSFGSIIKGHTFPEDKRQAFLRAFGRLPQRVLWKWENDTMPGKPDNVMIQKWMPQFDILSHPNVRAYIAHGGLLGTIEAVHNGVPMVVMPQFGDQHTNARAVEASGGGVVLQLYEADEEKIYNALRTVLDPKFRQGAKELSARFRDRPLPPLETAIYWVEYVARHRGARHMRTAAVGMPLYKYLLLDVIAFLLAVIAVLSVISFYVTRAILRKLFRKGSKQKTN